MERGRGGAFELRYRIADPDTPVRLDIYDVLGRRIQELEEPRRGPGEYVAVWDRRDTRSMRVVPGVYFVRLVAGNVAATRKLVITSL